MSVITISDDLDEEIIQENHSRSCSGNSEEKNLTDSPYSTNNPPDTDYSSSDDSSTSHNAPTTSSLAAAINHKHLQPSPTLARQPGALRQTKLMFERVDKETYREQCAQQAEKMKVFWEARKAARLACAEQEQEEKRAKDKLRKQLDRAQAKAEDIQAGRRNSDGQLVKDKQKASNKRTP